MKWLWSLIFSVYLIVLCNGVVYADNSMTDNDIHLIATIVMAEAEGESEEGQRLVVDTVLNRLSSEDYPDTVHDVIYQKNAFESVWNGRMSRVEVPDKLYDIVREEIGETSNIDVIFFASDDYSKYGEPLFKVGGHYFSKKGE